MHSISRTVVSLAALTALALSGAAQARPNGEARLARMLEGRTAGKPVDCLTLSEARDVETIDGVALVYGWGRTLYVNRTSHPHDLDSDNILVSRPHVSQVCKNDVIRFQDRSSHTFAGFVTLEQFVPYRKP